MTLTVDRKWTENSFELKTDNLHCPRIGPGYIKDGDKLIVLLIKITDCPLEKQLQNQLNVSKDVRHGMPYSNDTFLSQKHSVQLIKSPAKLTIWNLEIYE